jgi:hypothetical protein
MGLWGWGNSLVQNWGSAIPWAQAGPYEWGWGGHPMMWGAWGSA